MDVVLGAVRVGRNCGDGYGVLQSKDAAWRAGCAGDSPCTGVTIGHWLSDGVVEMSDVRENDKPDDWEHAYSVQVDGKTLEAMKVLAAYVLKSELPP